MRVSEERLNNLFDKTRGKCHLCHKQLVFKNYGTVNNRGAWEIEHSKPKSKGGSDHLNNLFASCVKCNREKGNGTNYSVRSKYNVVNAPLSESNKNKKIFSNTVKGLAAGAAAGRFFGPVGAVVGGVLGGLIGFDKNPDK